MLHTHDDFLSAIAAAPADRTLRLVYADWLDEQSDARGELVRVEEEMRELPVFADRFWELKPRRNELRAQAGSEWCGRMRYGTECEPVFRHGIPDGWRERWRLIREFTERWHRVPMPDVGGRQAEIAEEEARLGRTLPPSVREWIAFAHDVSHRPDYPVVFRDVYQMELLSGHPAISLLLQGEGDYHWTVLLADLQRVDPPVHGYHLDYGRETTDDFVPDDRKPLTDTVTSFAFEYGLAYLHGTGGCGIDAANPEELIRELKVSFPVHARWDASELFETDNIRVKIGPSIWGDTVRLEVEMFKPFPRDAIPACLWPYIPF